MSSTRRVSRKSGHGLCVDGLNPLQQHRLVHERDVEAERFGTQPPDPRRQLSHDAGRFADQGTRLPHQRGERHHHHHRTSRQDGHEDEEDRGGTAYARMRGNPVGDRVEDVGEHKSQEERRKQGTGRVEHPHRREEGGYGDHEGVATDAAERREHRDEHQVQEERVEKDPQAEEKEPRHQHEHRSLHNAPGHFAAVPHARAHQPASLIISVARSTTAACRRRRSWRPHRAREATHSRKCPPLAAEPRRRPGSA